MMFRFEALSPVENNGLQNRIADLLLLATITPRETHWRIHWCIDLALRAAWADRAGFRSDCLGLLKTADLAFDAEGLSAALREMNEHAIFDWWRP